MFAGIVFLDDSTLHSPAAPGATPMPIEEAVRRTERLHFLRATPVIWVARDVPSRPDAARLARYAASLGQEFGFATHAREGMRDIARLRSRFLRYVRLWTDGALDEGVALALARIDRECPGVLVDVMVPVRADRAPAAADVLRCVDAVGALHTDWNVRLCPAPDAPCDVRATARIMSEAISGMSARPEVTHRVRVVWEGLPLCLMEAVAEDGYGLEQDEVLAADGDARAPASRFSWRCGECVRRKDCAGLPASVPEADAEAAVRPYTGLVSSGISFVRVREGEGGAPVPGARCPLYFRNRDLDFRRTFYLRNDAGSLDVFTTESRDFASRHIFSLKNEREQVFLDLAPPLLLKALESQSPDRLKFSHHAAEHHDGKCCRFCYEFRYHALKMDAACRSCPQVGTCPAVFHRIDENMFLKEKEMWDREVTGRLRGRVLDVGCGKQPYRKSLNALLSAGTIEYFAVEPDTEALDGLREDLVSGTFLNMRFEDVEFPDSYFDHVLVIRSFQHVDDPVAVFDKIARISKPGAALTIIDAVPLVIAGTQAQVEALARLKAPSDFEHRRNWESSEVRDFVTSRFPFRLLVDQPVTPSSSFIWRLELVRT